MKDAKYSYNGYIIDYTSISKDEIYSQGMPTAFSAGVAVFIRSHKIDEFDNLIIINSIIKDSSVTDKDNDDYINISFQAFLYYELGTSSANIIISELDLINDNIGGNIDIFIKWATIYTLLGFANISNIFPYKNRFAFLAINRAAKPFIKKVIEINVKNMS